MLVSFLRPTLNEIVFRQYNERILHHRILQLARVGVCVRCARGPTKRCITLPGVNKPRGRGLARGSPLRLRLRPRLFLHLCISSAVTATPFTLIYERRPQYSFSFHLSLPLVHPRSSAYIPRSLFLSSRLYEDRRHRWSVGHPQIIFSRENSSRSSTAIAIFSNLPPSCRALRSSSNHATPGTTTEKQANNENTVELSKCCSFSEIADRIVRAFKRA